MFSLTCFKRILCTLVAMSTLHHAHGQQKQTITLCTDIAHHNLCSIPRLSDPSQGDVIGDPYAMYNFYTEAISNPQAHDKRKRAFKILNQVEMNNPNAWTSETICDTTTWQDLNLFCGSRDKPELCLIDTLTKGRTHTELGKAYLCGLLARPTADITLLKSRQKIIQTLVDNQSLFEVVDHLLGDIALSETWTTGLWDTELLMQYLDDNYFKLPKIGSFMNQSPVCLELKSLYEWFTAIASTGVLTISPIVLTLYGVSLFCTDTPLASSLTDCCFGNVGLLFKIPFLKNKWVQSTAALLVATISSLSVKASLQKLHAGFLYDDFFRKRLIYIAQYIKLAQSTLIAFAQDAPDLISSYTFVPDMHRFFNYDMSHDQNLIELSRLLSTETFIDHDLSIIFSRGNMLAAYYLLSKTKHMFETTIVSIGEIDAFLTLAKLIKESQDNPITFCFPSYICQSNTPSIYSVYTFNPSLALVDFWNPFIDPQTVVPNSINLGLEYGIPNMVVTGPNSAGKSTILKGIALAILFAQSFGISPAQRMIFTPFSYLATYMNVNDNIIDQESRFQAEARRIFEYGDNLEYLAQHGKFSFGIFDEILSGTSPAEGADLGHKVATLLGNQHNCVSIIATHFEKLTHLEEDTYKAFINYKVAVETEEDGSIQLNRDSKIKRLFTLTPGISHQHIAKEVFKEKGITNNSSFFRKCFGSQ